MSSGRAANPSRPLLALHGVGRGWTMPFANAEDRRAYRRAYYASHRAETIARVGKYRAANKEAISTSKRRYYQENRDTLAVAHSDYYRAHKDEAKAYRDAHREQQSVRNRDARLARRGLTENDYQTMLAAQLGLCANCRQPETHRDRHARITRLAIDHDHSTGAVRALLCHSCNTGIGLFRDDPALLRAAADYIESHQ